MPRKLRITQVRSLSGRTADQVGTLRALGIRRMHHTVEHEETPQIRGMVFKVRHLLRVEESRSS